MTASRIAPHLYQGSVPTAGEALPFDLVVLCALENQFSPATYGVRPFGRRARVMRVPLTDGNAPLAQHNVVRAYAAAREVARSHARGERVLVTCYLGLNRSGLVTALALVEMGFRAEQAVGAVKHARPGALRNVFFEQLVHNIAGRSLFRVPITQGAVA